MSVEQTGRRQHQVESEAPPLGDTVRDLEERFGPRIEEAKEQLQRVNVRVTGFIRENPGTALLCAVGIGYLIGKLASRK